eukprot:c20791_g1_i1.p1 GENE.c20791_g1_i1~~c20791_g1_i1.p1  ORF type:complete len:283 (+),score=47.85 c20791_g1_i1:39-851(+)
MKPPTTYAKLKEVGEAPTLTSKLNCTICFERFRAFGEDRIPVVLPCGHTFCRSCINELCARSTKPQIECPTCRANVSCPPGSNFPKNFLVIEAMTSNSTRCEKPPKKVSSQPQQISSTPQKQPTHKKKNIYSSSPSLHYFDFESAQPNGPNGGSSSATTTTTTKLVLKGKAKVFFTSALRLLRLAVIGAALALVLVLCVILIGLFLKYCAPPILKFVFWAVVIFVRGIIYIVVHFFVLVIWCIDSFFCHVSKMPHHCSPLPHELFSFLPW